jgi:N-acetylmuramoyl-L-alanine amidase
MDVESTRVEAIEAEEPISRLTPGPPGSVGRDSSTGNLCFESASVALRPRIWPEENAPLNHPVIEVPEDLEPTRVMVIAGHGATSSKGLTKGNIGCFCQQEADFNLSASQDLSRLLNATGLFEVVKGRTAQTHPTLTGRLRHLERSSAELMMELHSDARGGYSAKERSNDNGDSCWQWDHDPGFSILVADRNGSKALLAERLRLARALAGGLSDAGFPAYDGSNYTELYEPDEVPGVFLDRRGLFLLRKPVVPSVIIETHNAFDQNEAARWEESRVRDAFGRAVLAALIAHLTQSS